jgi:hypothetical protein
LLILLLILLLVVIINLAFRLRRLTDLLFLDLPITMLKLNQGDDLDNGRRFFNW